MGQADRHSTRRRLSERTGRATDDVAAAFFRYPDEAPFWEAITAAPAEATPRLVYADWLDDHDDPHADVFRWPAPFHRDGVPVGWAEAVGGVDCGSPLHQLSAWAFARITGRGPWLPFTLPDGRPVPQFVAYLLGVSRIRRDRPAAGPPPALRLVGVSAGFEGREWVFALPFRVGRGVGGLDLDCPDRSVSQRHAIVILTPTGWLVGDVRSTNGTWLNGTRIEGQPAGPLRVGDIVQFGRVAFRVVSATPGS